MSLFHELSPQLLTSACSLLKTTLGASKVVIFDHTIRRVEKPGQETPDTPESRKPVAFVHIDQTPASGLARVHRHCPEDAEHLLAGRAQVSHTLPHTKLMY